MGPTPVTAVTPGKLRGSDPGHPRSRVRRAFFAREVDLFVTRCILYGILYMYRLLKMESISYTSARSNLAKTMEKVCDDHAPVAITRKGEGAVVLISMEDYQALEETAYLLRSPKNARRLIQAVVDLEEGRGQERKLTE